MPALIKLPPDAVDVPITFVVPQDRSQYLSWLYNRDKLPGETIADFAMRLVNEAVKTAYSKDQEKIQRETSIELITALRNESKIFIGS